MESVSCNVIYVDRCVAQDRSVKAADWAWEKDPSRWESTHLAENVGLLLQVFDEVHLCSAGGACLTQWLSLQEASIVALRPTLFILDTPFQESFPEKSRSRSPSPSRSSLRDDRESQEEELYGLPLLQRIISESYLRNTSKLVVTVPIVGFPYGDHQPGGSNGTNGSGLGMGTDWNLKERRSASTRMMKRCLDLGATDVMTNPMNVASVANLEVHAYRAYRDAARDQKAILELRRGRKRSWVGVNEEKPFAYLREAMVSNLMNWICRIGSEAEEGFSGPIRLSVPADKQAEISSAVGQWHFCAHEFTDDELVVAASVMFKHALAIPELGPWRISNEQLLRFLLACRTAYNEFVPYHNFRHVVDVLQATFHFLVCIGALPPYRYSGGVLSEARPKSPVAKLLQPFEALTLLITAIGHDVGHPGVNNGFLVTLNAPLAQLYNDRSVLESFHCAAYSQILRRYWPSAFSDTKMRALMISSILATDMGLHFDYMKKLADLQEKLRATSSIDDWPEAAKNEQKSLACALLIKCADISNVARRHDTALQWSQILSDEFARQASMEMELDIPTSLMSVPKKDTISLANSQTKFMNVFAIPLFQTAADLLPAMQYCVDELHVNKRLFDRLLIEGPERPSPCLTSQRDNGGEFSSKTIGLADATEPVRDAPQASTRASRALPEVVEPQRTPNSVVTQQSESLPRSYQNFRRPADGLAVNGIVTNFSSPTDFCPGEPFNPSNYQPQGHSRQRCSETTEGSSARYTGDWASQATSATTGKMPLSPSTQGTSIVSKDSFERLNSIQATSTTAPDSAVSAPESARSEPDFKLDSYPATDEEDPAWRNAQFQGAKNNHANSNMTSSGTLEPEPGACRQLKKKPSRFRLNVNGLQSLFKKHKNSSSPPMQAADTG